MAGQLEGGGEVAAGEVADGGLGGGGAGEGLAGVAEGGRAVAGLIGQVAAQGGQLARQGVGGGARRAAWARRVCSSAGWARW